MNEYAPLNPEQLAHYERKLAYETDSWDLYIALRDGEDIVILDVRSPEAYEREHIPGAKNLFHHTITPESVAGMRRDCLYVTYCDGIGCNGSTKGAMKLARLGFRVKELIGGFDWWRRDGYATEGREARPGTEVICGCAA